MHFDAFGAFCTNALVHFGSGIQVPADPYDFRLKGGNTINGGWAELSVCHKVRRRRVRIICWDQPLLIQPE